MIGRTGRTLAISLALISLTLFWSNGARSGDASDLLEPMESGVEVLLNAPGLEFDLAVLESLKAKGEATVPLPPDALLEGQPLGPYLLRSSYDPDLGVVIASEDLTEFLLSQGYDVPMRGISVSIVVPGEKVLVKRNFTQYDVYMDLTARFDGRLVEDLEGLGFTNVKLFTGGPAPSVSFRYLTTELTLGNETLERDGTRNVLVLRVMVQEGAMDQDLEGRIVDLIGMLGGSPSLWDGASKTGFSLLHAMIRPSPDIDVMSIDWSAAMRAELEHLTEIGLISGLGTEDLDTISSLSGAGTFGSNGRVFYDNRTTSWGLYDSSDLPTPLFLPEGGIPIYGEEWFPQRQGQDGDGWNWPLVLMVTVASVLITLVLGSVLYQRIDRATKLNNARRLLIFNTIKQNPGIHFSALMKDLGLKPGVTSYHINRMEKEELIKSYQDGMYRRFYLFEEKVETKMRLSDLQRLILETIKEEPGISQIEISKVIGKSKVVINYHVRFLRDLGVLFLETEGRETHCFLTNQGIALSNS